MAEKLSSLQVDEQEVFEQLEAVETPRDGAVSLTELGTIHLRMGETGRGLREMYAGLRGLEPRERAVVVALTLGYFAGAAYSPDYATLDHAAALRRQAAEARDITEE